MPASLVELTKRRQQQFTVDDIKYYSDKHWDDPDIFVPPRGFDKFLSTIRPTTKKEVALWLRVCLQENGLIGKFSNKPNDLMPGHSGHVDFISDSFFDIVGNCIVMGNRSGGKTLGFAALMLMETLFKAGIGISHLGAEKSQALNCYKYYRKMLLHPLFNHLFHHRKLTMGSVELLNGSTVSILTGTMKGVNSTHCEKVQIDEIDLMEWNILQEAFSIVSDKGGGDGSYLPATRLTSTRKFADGSMQKMLDEAVSRGFKIYQWEIFDTIERCRIAKSPESIPMRDPSGDGRIVLVSEECTTCSLLYRCMGLAKHSNGGIMSLSNTMSTSKTLDDNKWETQWRCSKSEESDLIFPMFNPANHVIDYNATLRNMELISEHEFNDGLVHFSPDFDVLAGQDAGYECPATVVGQFLDADTFIIFEEVNERHIANSVLLEDHLVPLANELSIAEFFCDPSNPTLMAEMELNGLYVTPANNNVQVGLDLLKSLFKTNRLFIDKRCVTLISTLKKYKKRLSSPSPRPNQDDHHIDSLRYLTMMVCDPEDAEMEEVVS